MGGGNTGIPQSKAKGQEKCSCGLQEQTQEMGSGFTHPPLLCSCLFSPKHSLPSSRDSAELTQPCSAAPPVFTSLLFPVQSYPPSHPVASTGYSALRVIIDTLITLVTTRPLALAILLYATLQSLTPLSFECQALRLLAVLCVYSAAQSFRMSRMAWKL